MLENYEVGRCAYLCFSYDLRRSQQVGVSNDFTNHPWNHGGQPFNTCLYYHSSHQIKSGLYSEL